jgi:hypothetical protein
MDALGIEHGPKPSGGTTLPGFTRSGHWNGQMLLGTAIDNVMSGSFHLAVELDSNRNYVTSILDGQHRLISMLFIDNGLMPFQKTGTDLDKILLADGKPLFESGRVFMRQQTLFEDGAFTDEKDEAIKMPWEVEDPIYLTDEYPELVESYENCLLNVALYDLTQSHPSEGVDRKSHIFDVLNNKDYTEEMNHGDMFNPEYWHYPERYAAVQALMNRREVRQVLSNSKDTALKAAAEMPLGGTLPAELSRFVGLLFADAFAILSDGKYPGVTYNSKTMHSDVKRLLRSDYLTDDIFNDVMVCIEDVLLTAKYATNLHRAVNEDGTLAVKTAGTKVDPVYKTNRLVDAIRGMIKYRMYGNTDEDGKVTKNMTLTFDTDTGKTLVAVNYNGGDLTSIRPKLSDSASLDEFWENETLYRGSRDDCESPSDDSWYHATVAIVKAELEKSRKLGETSAEKLEELVEARLPKTIVIDTKTAKGGLTEPLTVDELQTGGRNTMKYVLSLSRFYAVCWKAFIDYEGTTVSNLFDEAVPESDKPGEETEPKA